MKSYFTFFMPLIDDFSWIFFQQNCWIHVFIIVKKENSSKLKGWINVRPSKKSFHAYFDPFWNKHPDGNMLNLYFVEFLFSKSFLSLETFLSKFQSISNSVRAIIKSLRDFVLICEQNPKMQLNQICLIRLFFLEREKKIF